MRRCQWARLSFALKAGFSDVLPIQVVDNARAGHSLHSCHPINEILIYNRFFRVGNFSYFELVIFVHFSTLLTGKAASVFIIPLPLA
jgi:hypothetical protein